MFVGRGQDERALAAEHGKKPVAKRHRVSISHDREEDDDGAFFVAFVRHEGREPWDFTTFGSRKKAEADELAREFVRTRRYQIVDKL